MSWVMGFAWGAAVGVMAGIWVMSLAVMAARGNTDEYQGESGYPADTDWQA